jgi:predicted DNA-binding transcriptional regulator AlpA
MSWRDAMGCAVHLGIGEATFLSLVRSGKFPRASYHLGPRLPRWSTEALDRAMNPNSASDVTREAVDALVQKNEEKARSRRQAHAG